MKHPFEKRFLLIPIGLIFLAGTIGIAQRYHLSDVARGILMGIGIGLIALSLILRARCASR